MDLVLGSFESGFEVEMSLRTERETSILLALMLKNSEQSRARVSKVTLRRISGRKNIRAAFLISVSEQLANNFGIYLIELGSGGYALVTAKALEAARPITTKRHLPGITDELRRGKHLDFDELEEELYDPDEQNDQDQDE